MTWSFAFKPLMICDRSAIVLANHDGHQMCGVAVGHRASSRPSRRKIRAAVGTMKVRPRPDVLKWTWASEPGISSPERLSTSISASKVRLAGSMASAVRTSVPTKVLPGMLGKSEVDLHAALERHCIQLRHIRIDAQSSMACM